MQIAPPFGYREIVPLLKTQKVRLLVPGEVAEFARRGNAIPISYTEFQLAAREYPIVFTSGDEGKSFAPVAVLGIAAGENLFVANAAWARGVYVPAYARRYPFCMARVTLDQVEQKDRVICIEKAFIDEQGEPMFDAKGQPSAKWSDIERLLSEYEADLERSREMCAILGDYAGEREKPGRPECRAAQEPDAQGAAGARLPAPAVARKLRAAARAQGDAHRGSG